MATDGRKLAAGGVWELLGAAPMFLQMKGQNPVAFVVADAVPAADAPWVHDLDMTDRFADIGLTGNVYARALGGAAVVVWSR